MAAGRKGCANWATSAGPTIAVGYALHRLQFRFRLGSLTSAPVGSDCHCSRFAARSAPSGFDRLFKLFFRQSFCHEHRSAKPFADTTAATSGSTRFEVSAQPCHCRGDIDSLEWAGAGSRALRLPQIRCTLNPSPLPR